MAHILAVTLRSPLTVLDCVVARHPNRARLQSMLANKDGLTQDDSLSVYLDYLLCQHLIPL
jgi:hypothetical protein